MTKDDRIIEVDAVADLSPHNKALYEAGKTLLIESIAVGREFCKFMTTTALSAIPIYLALLKLVLPEGHVLQRDAELLFLAPALIFLASAVAFILGYFPRRGSLSLDMPDEIEAERSRTILRRQGFALGGFLIFAIGVVVAAWQVVQCLCAAS